MSKMHRLPDYYYPARTNKAYMQGFRDATESPFRDNTDRASFLATIRLPSDSTPLRREDFFEFDDYMLGFYEGVIDKYKAENKKLYEDKYQLQKRLEIYEDAKVDKNRNPRRRKRTR